MSIDIVGHAIVSADGMIADRDHRMPAALRSEADWRRFQAALDSAALVVLGRLGHEAHPNPGRKRLVVTSRAAWLERDPGDDNIMLWNPDGISFRRVLAGLGIADGTIAVLHAVRPGDGRGCDDSRRRALLQRRPAARDAGAGGNAGSGNGGAGGGRHPAAMAAGLSAGGRTPRAGGHLPINLNIRHRLRS